jgi:hypothetical protein
VDRQIDVAERDAVSGLAPREYALLVAMAIIALMLVAFMAWLGVPAR